MQGDAPSFTVTSVQNFTPAQDAEMARRVQGTLPGALLPGARLRARRPLRARPGRAAEPERHLDGELQLHRSRAPRWTPRAPPRAGRRSTGTACWARASQATSSDQQILGQTHNFVVCATDEIGISQSDVPNIAGNILPDLSNFPELTDRLQQGLLNELFLGRLMIHADGFVSDAAFHVDGTDVGSAATIDTSRLYYNGNSQGGILGGALTAIAPDFTRASLGVPAMNYSVLLNRSIDFDLYSAASSTRPTRAALTQQLALSLIQMLWDRSEPNGYAHRMTTDPLPNTPPHEVLMDVAFGDHQVTNWQADVEARTIGAQIHDPVVFDGRWPGVDVALGHPADRRLSRSRARRSSTGTAARCGPNPTPPPAMIGTDPPPIENLPNRTGVDPHGHPRVAPAEMQMVSDFLRPDALSAITDTCLGPCYAGGFTGP